MYILFFLPLKKLVYGCLFENILLYPAIQICHSCSRARNTHQQKVTTWTLTIASSVPHVTYWPFSITWATRNLAYGDPSSAHLRASSHKNPIKIQMNKPRKFEKRGRAQIIGGKGKRKGQKRRTSFEERVNLYTWLKWWKGKKKEEISSRRRRTGKKEREIKKRNKREEEKKQKTRNRHIKWWHHLCLSLFFIISVSQVELVPKWPTRYS